MAAQPMRRQAPDESAARSVHIKRRAVSLPLVAVGGPGRGVGQAERRIVKVLGLPVGALGPDGVVLVGLRRIDAAGHVLRVGFVVRLAAAPLVGRCGLRQADAVQVRRRIFGEIAQHALQQLRSVALEQEALETQQVVRTLSSAEGGVECDWGARRDGGGGREAYRSRRRENLSRQNVFAPKNFANERPRTIAAPRPNTRTPCRILHQYMKVSKKTGGNAGWMRLISCGSVGRVSRFERKARRGMVPWISDENESIPTIPRVQLTTPKQPRVTAKTFVYLRGTGVHVSSTVRCCMCDATRGDGLLQTWRNRVGKRSATCHGHAVQCGKPRDDGASSVVCRGGKPASSATWATR